MERVRAESSRHGTSLAFGRLLWLRPGEVAVAFPPGAAFQKSNVTGQSGRAVVEKILSEHFGAPTRLVVEEGAELIAAAAPSLAEEEQRSRAEHERSTSAMARNHPAVRAALRALGGEVEHVQVLDRPRGDAPRAEGEDEAADPGRPE